MTIQPIQNVSSPDRNRLDLSAISTKPVSVETGDVIELSGMARLAQALGPEGLRQFQNLTTGKGLSEDRLATFVQNLFGAGKSGDQVGSILGMFQNLTASTDTTQTDDLFSQIESRVGSGNLEYLDQLDNVFNLGYRDTASIFSAARDLNDKDFQDLLSSLGELLQRGVIGKVTVDNRGNRTEVFLENEVGSEYARLPLWPKRFP